MSTNLVVLVVLHLCLDLHRDPVTGRRLLDACLCGYDDALRNERGLAVCLTIKEIVVIKV